MKFDIVLPLLSSITLAIGIAAQPGTPAPGGQPSKQPRQSNPQPRPNTPDNGRDKLPIERRSEQNGREATRAQDPYTRPFSFVSPENETRFLESARRLDATERRMAESNQEAIKRLGAIRQLPPDRQNAAMLDLLQQLLQERAALNEYLVDARTTWTGDLADDNAVEPNSPSADPQHPAIPPQQPQQPR